MASSDRSTQMIRSAAAALSGVLVFLSFPNWNMSELCWFALVPLLIAAEGVTVRRGFVLGLVAGTVTNVGGFHWITYMLHEFGHLPTVVTWAILLLQGVTQGLAMAIGVALWRYLVRRGAPSALSAFLAMWAGEVVTPMIFPWFMGNGITAEVQMIQIADLGGLSLVSAQLYAANAALAELGHALMAKRRPALRFVTLTVVAVALSFGYGTMRVGQVTAQQETAKTLRIGLVEGDVGIWEKEGRHLGPEERVRTLRKNLLKHQRMSAELDKRGAELIVWPESAYQPYGAIPTVRTSARFIAIGSDGTVLRQDDKRLVTVRHEKRGLPRTTGLLTGLSSPQGNLLRYLIDGQKVVTSSPWGTSVVELPKGVKAVDTATAGVNLFGKNKPGFVLGRRGRVWHLDWPKQPLGKRRPLPPPARPELAEIPGHDVGKVDMTAAAVNGTGDFVAVGRQGQMLRLMGHSVQRKSTGTTEDLWAIAADPLGRVFVAAGSGGVILMGSSGKLRVVHRTGTDLFATWFAPDGTAWVAGAKGQLLKRRRNGRWTKVKSPTRSDLLAGAMDAKGRVLVVGRGGQAWLRVGRSWRQVRKEGSELTDLVGFQAQASYVIPRGAKRIVPATTRLPKGPLLKAVDKDAGTPEFDRNTPRRGFSAPLLMGAMTHGGELPMRNADCKACYNSALLIDRDGTVRDLYDKAFLLVFGEYMPFGEDYPQLYDLLPESSRFQAGTRTRPVVLGDARIGLLICYEDLLPDHAQRVAAHDPNVYINMTNDAWFGMTAEPYHHMQLSQMRSVEYRRWLIRSTNTGVSVFIDAMGRRVKETQLTGAETLMADVPLLEGKTVYAVLGDWPLILLLVLLLLLWARALKNGGQPSGGKAGSRKKKKPTKATAKKAATGGKTSSAKGESPKGQAAKGKSSKAKGANAKRPKGAASGKPEVLEPGSFR
ncbi:MAG: apolipoprotein N-acyltransferase [Myxococcales bacterium]|nr:apolipoprotein N-acyltransferase [Myxococcales bacterium]